jgi:hypothetical protein
MSIVRWAAGKIIQLQHMGVGARSRGHAAGAVVRPGGPADDRASAPPPPLDPEALFASAVRASADMHMDWMCVYAQMSGPFERLYCLEKALALDPHSEAARNELALLASGR